MKKMRKIISAIASKMTVLMSRGGRLASSPKAILLASLRRDDGVDRDKSLRTA